MSRRRQRSALSRSRWAAGPADLSELPGSSGRRGAGERRVRSSRSGGRHSPRPAAWPGCPDSSARPPTRTSPGDRSRQPDAGVFDALQAGAGAAGHPRPPRAVHRAAPAAAPADRLSVLTRPLTRGPRPGRPGHEQRRDRGGDVPQSATARTHVGRAMTKLGARDRAQLVLADQTGLTTPTGNRRFRPVAKVSRCSGF